MTEPTPSLRFEVAGKIVNFAAVLGQVKPWKDWTIGEKGVLDRLGFELVNRDPTRSDLGLNDLKALVIYYAMRANRQVVPADINGLSEEVFGKIVQAFVPVFGPCIFPPDERAGSGEPETPFGNGAETPSTPSAVPAAGDPPTSTS